MSKTKEYEKIKENFFSLVEDEVEYGIVIALNWYESLNLKKLAIMLNKPESTTLRYIRKLKVKEIIVFDSEKSGDSWGKFYKLSPSVKQIYDEYMQSFDEQVEQITSDLKNLSTEEDLERYVVNGILKEEKLEEIPLLKRYFHFISNLQNVMLNEAINKIEEFNKRLEEEENKGIEEKKEKKDIDIEEEKKKNRDRLIQRVSLSPMDISIYVNSLKISKWSHIFKINDLIFSFMKELEHLKNEIEEEMNNENVPEEKRTTQFVNIFTGNLDISYEIKEEEKK